MIIATEKEGRHEEEQRITFIYFCFFKCVRSYKSYR